MLPKTFDKIIDGIEYRLVNYRHFIKLVKRKGLCLSYNDELVIKDIIQEILPGCVDLGSLEALLVHLGIEDLKPTKHLDYSSLTANVIRLFNSISSKLQTTSQNLCQFLGNDNLKSVEISTSQGENLYLVIDPVDLRKILAKSKIINFGEDLDEEFLCK